MEVSFVFDAVAFFDQAEQRDRCDHVASLDVDNDNLEDFTNGWGAIVDG